MGLLPMNFVGKSRCTLYLMSDKEWTIQRVQRIKKYDELYEGFTGVSPVARSPCRVIFLALPVCVLVITVDIAEKKL